MIVQIDDIIDGTSIQITDPSQCEAGTVEHSVAEEVFKHCDCITMGKVVGHVVPMAFLHASFAQKRRREAQICELHNARHSQAQ
jgi:hypothetical protein